MCPFRATRSERRQWAWWKRHLRLPAWRRWSGCSNIWRRSCTSLIRWTGCWPWSLELQGREERLVDPEIKTMEDVYKREQDVRRVTFTALSIWTYQTGPPLSAAPPLYWPPWSSGRPAALCWCCPDSFLLGCQCTTSWFSGCRCLVREQHQTEVQHKEMTKIIIPFHSIVAYSLMFSPNSIKEYGRETVGTLFPCCSWNSACRSSK